MDAQFENPYAASEILEDPPFEVRGKLLVVGKRTVLPDYCVFTGKATGWVHRVWKRLGPKIGSRTCEVRIGMSWPYRLRMWGLLWSCIGVPVLLSVLSMALGRAQRISVLIPVLIIPLLIFLRRRDPLQVVRYEGGRFWIEGCSEVFLQRLVATE